MKRLLFASIATVPLLLALPGHSGAVIVECANCSTIFQQLMDAANQAKALATQALQYKAEFDSNLRLVTAGTELPMSVFQGIQSDIGQVRGLANAGSLLTGNAGSILSRLQSADGYANQASMTPGQISNQYAMWQQTLGNAGNSLGRTLGVQQGQMQAATATMATAQAHSAGAVGQMQAIQAGNEMTAQTVYALQEVQTTLTAAAQDAAARGLVADERQAAHDAAGLEYFGYQPVATTGSQRF